MRSRTFLNKTASVCLVLAMMATAALAQTSHPIQLKTADQAAILGVWRAEADRFPFVALTLDNENGALSGAVLFYFHRREAPGQPVTSTPGVPEPLLNPRFDGKTLTFQVSHRRAHPPGSLNDPPVSFRMTLTGADNAGLVNIGESGSANESSASAGLPMTRSDY